MSKKLTNKICIKSHAKINLHLEIIGKRDDGFHELAMIMQNIDLADYLELENNDNGEIELTSDCEELSLGRDNLIVKTGYLLKQMFNKKELGAKIFLKKNIPIGAGLAGGSSNAAATLLGLNKLWNLNLDKKVIDSLSASLGSDVPFFIDGGSQFCFGRGEILEKYNFTSEYGVILLKNPKISISTSHTYKKFSQKYSDKYDMDSNRINNIRNNIKSNGFNHLNISNEKILIRNDLQLIVENENDSVKKALNLLSNLRNCLTYSMSGSGPTCFAIFKDLDVANQVFYKNYKIFKNNGFDAWVCKFINGGITFH